MGVEVIVNVFVGVFVGAIAANSISYQTEVAGEPALNLVFPLALTSVKVEARAPKLLSA